MLSQRFHQDWRADMEKIRVIHDLAGRSLTVWFDDPSKEVVCQESGEEVVFMKDAADRIIGFEMLNVSCVPGQALSLETIVQGAA